MASRTTTRLPSPPLSRDQHSNRPAPMAPRSKLQEGIQGGHGTGISLHSHLPTRRAPQPQLRHADPFLEKCIERFIQGGTYGRGVKPILKGAYVPGQKAFRFMPLDRLLPRDHEKLKVHLKYDERASLNPTWVNRWMRVFSVAPRLEDSYLNVPMVVCKRADSGDQPRVPLYRKETYMNIRSEQNRDTAVERICAGIKCAQMGLLEKALGEYTLAIEADPSCAAAYLTRGCTFANMIMWQEAVDDFRSVLKLDPSDISAQQYLATAIEESRLQKTGFGATTNGSSIESQVYVGRNTSITGNGSMYLPRAQPNMQIHQRREAYGGDDGDRVYTASIGTHIPHHNEQRTSTNAIPLGAPRKEGVRPHQSEDEHLIDLHAARNQSRDVDSSRDRRGEVHRDRTQHSFGNPAHVRSRSRSRADNGSVIRRPSKTGGPDRRRSPNMDGGAHSHLEYRAGRYHSRSPSLRRNGRRYVPSSPRVFSGEGNRSLDAETQYGVPAVQPREQRSPAPWDSSDMDAIPTGPRVPEGPTVLVGSPRRDMSTSPRHKSPSHASPPTKKRRESRWGTVEHENGDRRLSRIGHRHDEYMDNNRRLSITSQRRSSVGKPEVIHFLSPKIENTIPAATASEAETVTKSIPDFAEGAVKAVTLSEKFQDSDSGFQPTVEDMSTFNVETGRSLSTGSLAGEHGSTDQVKALSASFKSKNGQSALAQTAVNEHHPLPQSKMSRLHGKRSIVTLDRGRDLSELSKSLSSRSAALSQDPVDRATPRVLSDLPNVPSGSSVNAAQQLGRAKGKGFDELVAQEVEVVLFRRRK